MISSTIHSLNRWLKPLRTSQKGTRIRGISMIAPDAIRDRYRLIQDREASALDALQRRIEEWPGRASFKDAKAELSDLVSRVKTASPLLSSHVRLIERLENTDSPHVWFAQREDLLKEIAAIRSGALDFFEAAQELKNKGLQEISLLERQAQALSRSYRRIEEPVQLLTEEVKEVREELQRVQELAKRLNKAWWHCLWSRIYQFLLSLCSCKKGGVYV